MDDFKSFLKDKRKPTKKANLAEHEDLELNINIPKEEMNVQVPQKKANTQQKKKDTLAEAQKILSEDTSIPTFSEMPTTGYIGAFNYVPEPSMFAEGSEYRNKNNGTVYKKVGNLWEEYIRDGRDGRSFSPVGGGCGVAEVNQIFNSKIIVSSAAPVGDVIPGTIWIVV